MKNKLEEKYGSWLDQELKLPTQNKSEVEAVAGCSKEYNRPGRPRKLFSECSKKTKRRKTEHLREAAGPAELALATQISLKTSDEKEAANLMENALRTPTRAAKILSAYKEHSGSCKSALKYSADDALALIMDAKLSKSQYTLLRVQAKQRNVDLYPTYNEVGEAKLNCYTYLGDITVTEISARVNLQSLLDHTARRIIQTISPVSFETETLVLFSKWGCDGSTGQQQYKQLFTGEQHRRLRRLEIKISKDIESTTQGKVLVKTQ